MRFFRQLIVAAFAVAFSSMPAMTANLFYDHNGSRMRVNVQGNDVRIYYEQPRSGLRGVGVRSGTLLFDGKVSGGVLEGMSRIFNANCGEVDYFVSGNFVPHSPSNPLISLF